MTADLAVLLTRLESLTDAAEAAVATGDWPRVEVLMRERGEVVDELRAQIPDPERAPVAVRDRLRAVGQRDVDLRTAVAAEHRSTLRGAGRSTPARPYSEPSFVPATLLNRRV